MSVTLAVVTRREAKEKGLKFYFTGKPCKLGNIAKRRTNDCHCLCADCNRKINERQLKYYENNREEVNEHRRKYHKNNREKEKERLRKYYENNREKINECNRKWAKNNQEKINEYCRKWKKNNPEMVWLMGARHRARKTSAEGSHTLNEWQTLKESYNYQCVICGEKKKLTIDHIVPLSKGGSDYIENIQPLCISCNSTKGTKLMSEVMSRRCDNLPINFHQGGLS